MYIAILTIRKQGYMLWLCSSCLYPIKLLLNPCSKLRALNCPRVSLGFSNTV